MAIGAAQTLLEAAQVSSTLPTDDADPGVIIAADGDINSALELFMKGIQDHRHPMRKANPPMA